MTLQNRVLPTGEIVAHPARGVLTGNRGILHRDDRTLGDRRWTHKAWICCTLDWQGRRRPVMTGRTWTELFFLDEAVALAAGHRPCARCRRADYARFHAVWTLTMGPSTAQQIDRVLHDARVVMQDQRHGLNSAAVARRGVADGHRDPNGVQEAAEDTAHPMTGMYAAGNKPRDIGPVHIAASQGAMNRKPRAGGAMQRTHTATLGHLPAGTFVLWHDKPHIVGRLGLQRCAPAGYQLSVAKDKGAEVTVLTPAPLVAVLAAGYVPHLHDSLVV